MTDAVEQVRAAVQAFMDALDRGDLDGLVALWDPEILVANHGTPTLSGSAALRERYVDRMAAYRTKSEWHEEHVLIRGTLAVVVGRFVIAMTAKQGAQDRKAKGRVMLTYGQNSDGAWRLMGDIDNE